MSEPNQFRISVDLSDVLNAVPAVHRHIFPLLADAVDGVAQMTRMRWIQQIDRSKIKWQQAKDDYRESIKYKSAGFKAVVWTDYQGAEGIENGLPARDMKEMLNTSSKVRRTKDGRRFMIIPIRHNTPGNDAHAKAMPQQVYDAAYGLKASRVIGNSKRLSGELTSIHKDWGTRPLKKQTPFMSSIATRKPMMVAKAEYKWGEKLDTSQMEGLSKRQKARYNGMYRMDNRTPGGKRYSAYMTFRVMMEGSKGWIYPAQPGLHIVQKVTATMQPLAEKVFREAVVRSLS